MKHQSFYEDTCTIHCMIFSTHVVAIGEIGSCCCCRCFDLLLLLPFCANATTLLLPSASTVHQLYFKPASKFDVSQQQQLFFPP